MQWLVDIDQAVEDGVIGAEAGETLKRRGRDGMVGYAIGLALSIGVVMVIGGLALLLNDRAGLMILGVLVAGAGVWGLLKGDGRLSLVSNAAAIIGAALALGAAGTLLHDVWEAPLGVGLALGLPAAGLGYWLRRDGPETLEFLGGWLIVMGAALHVTGLLASPSDGRYAWIALHYVAAICIACGAYLDVRFLTAIAVIPLATALSSRTFYFHATYGIAIYEATLTILQMAAIGGLALYVSAQLKERFARHARILGQMAVIWANMAFWIGSLWGDEVGKHLWGPRRADFDSAEGWRQAHEAFLSGTLVISDDVFAALWALGLIALGGWAAYTARRAVLNICVVFGAIHFYTQYFERLEATPGAFVVAGIIAIAAAWGLREFNRKQVDPAP